MEYSGDIRLNILIGTAKAKALRKPRIITEVYCILYRPVGLGLKVTALVFLSFVGASV